MTTTQSVVKLSPECQQHFQDLKLNNKYQGVIFKINKETYQMVIDKTLPVDCSFKSLTDCFKTNECRIIVYRYKITGSNQSKLVFIYYGPEGSSQEDRVLYSNSKVTLGITFKGIDVKIAGTKPEELTEQIIKERCSPKVQA